MISYKKRLNFKSLKSEDGEYSVLDFLPQTKIVECSSVRTGLLDVIDSLSFSEDDFVLLPPICPEGLVLPFQKRKIKYEFYHLVNDFQIDVHKLKDQIEDKNCRAIFIIHYFGFFNEQIISLKEMCVATDTLLFEDIVHGFIGKDNENRQLGLYGDIAFCSYSKFLSVPDGAAFLINNPNLNIKFNLKRTSLSKLSNFANLVSLLLNNVYLHVRLNFSRWFIKKLSLLIYSIYYYILCSFDSNVAMSDITKKLLSNIDLNLFLEERRSVFKKLNTHLKIYPENYLPLTPGYPIINTNIDFRDLRNTLFREGVESIMYIRAWDYIPDCPSFDYERKLLYGHILLPLDVENKNLYTDDFINKLKHIIEEKNDLLPTSKL